MECASSNSFGVQQYMLNGAITLNPNKTIIFRFCLLCAVAAEVEAEATMTTTTTTDQTNNK